MADDAVHVIRLGSIAWMSPHPLAEARSSRKAVFADRQKGLASVSGLKGGRVNTHSTRFKSPLGNLTADRGRSALNDRSS